MKYANRWNYCVSTIISKTVKQHIQNIASQLYQKIMSSFFQTLLKTTVSLSKMSFKVVIITTAKEHSIPSLFTKNIKKILLMKVFVYRFLEKVLNLLKLSIQRYKNVSILVMALVSSTRPTKHFLTSATIIHILVPMLSGISLRPLMRKALGMVLKVLSNALLVMQASGHCKNQSILG